jgi:hypothetical protein
VLLGCQRHVPVPEESRLLEGKSHSRTPKKAKSLEVCSAIVIAAGIIIFLAIQLQADVLRVNRTLAADLSERPKSDISPYLLADPTCNLKRTDYDVYNRTDYAVYQDTVGSTNAAYKAAKSDSGGRPTRAETLGFLPPTGKYIWGSGRIGTPVYLNTSWRDLNSPIPIYAYPHMKARLSSMRLAAPPTKKVTLLAEQQQTSDLGLAWWIPVCKQSAFSLELLALLLCVELSQSANVRRTLGAFLNDHRRVAARQQPV